MITSIHLALMKKRLRYFLFTKAWNLSPPQQIRRPLETWNEFQILILHIYSHISWKAFSLEKIERIRIILTNDSSSGKKSKRMNIPIYRNCFDNTFNFIKFCCWGFSWGISFWLKYISMHISSLSFKRKKAKKIFVENINDPFIQTNLLFILVLTWMNSAIISKFYGIPNRKELVYFEFNIILRWKNVSFSWRIYRVIHFW